MKLTLVTLLYYTILYRIKDAGHFNFLKDEDIPP